MTYDEEHRVAKICAIIWGVDPNGVKRLFLRHNKPYDGKHPDEWTFVWGCVEEDESFPQAAARETEEETGLNDFLEVTESGVTNEYIGLHGKSITHFVMLKVKNIEVPITLNEESIGYDWKIIPEAKKFIRTDEYQFLDQIDAQE